MNWRPRYNPDRLVLVDAPFAARLARRFHEIYEEAAPLFGYETRAESAKPWSEVPEENQRLMIYVCERIEQELIEHVRAEFERTEDLSPDRETERS